MGSYDTAYLRIGILAHRREQEMERMQLQYGKALLGVGKTCASEVVRGELGWWRLVARVDFLRLKFWARVTRMSTTGYYDKYSSRE